MELTGICASVGPPEATEGDVEGRAAVMYNAPSNGDVLPEDGFVLVASMTTPDYVPIMRKASAIVTDYGGLTCHAAIVAREFGIPCVVGVKSATSKLTTGQTVRVIVNRATREARIVY